MFKAWRAGVELGKRKGRCRRIKTFRAENLHNFCPSPDGSVEFRRLRWTRRLLFLYNPSAMRDPRSCRDRLWRRRSGKIYRNIDES
jgi:hypothetical protein